MANDSLLSQLDNSQTVVAYSRKLAPVQTNIIPVSQLGIYNDGTFGKSTINYVTQLLMNVPNPVQVENGDIVKLYPGKPEVYDKAPSGRLYVDGNISVIEDAQSIKDRKNLSANGYIEATILITPKGNIHKRPVLTFRGIPVDDTEEFVYGLEDAIEEITRTFKLGSKQQEHNLIDALKIACRKFSKEKTGKKPFTNINLVRI